ncbi:MAG: type II toxin-antitoxin system VapC family toxin [Trueperaceae bacterium]|nr:MAG: type II toxin-antitoxin system VapC family toxin [Trueperaceae bacterium]
MKFLLDTHVLLYWLWQDPRLSEKQRDQIEAAGPESPLWISEITLWEIATLHSLGRIELHLSLRDFLERATAPPLVERIGISPAIAAEVAALPDSFHRDPGDRIIVASARILGATLLTQDERIRSAKLVPTVA